MIRAVPPSASTIPGSLHDVGYSLETAIADIIDNSVAANATAIDTGYGENNGDPVVTILDDGFGISVDVQVAPKRLDRLNGMVFRHGGGQINRGIFVLK